MRFPPVIVAVDSPAKLSWCSTVAARGTAGEPIGKSGRSVVGSRRLMTRAVFFYRQTGAISLNAIDIIFRLTALSTHRHMRVRFVASAGLVLDTSIGLALGRAQETRTPREGRCPA